MSKAREEAESVCSKYYLCDSENIKLNGGMITTELAVRCALIHVDGIIEEYEELHYRCLSLSQYLPYIEFWQEVKQELNKML